MKISRVPLSTRVAKVTSGDVLSLLVGFKPAVMGVCDDEFYIVVYVASSSTIGRASHCIKMVVTLLISYYETR